jgi:hypothetical protein
MSDVSCTKKTTEVFKNFGCLYHGIADFGICADAACFIIFISPDGQCH